MQMHPASIWQLPQLRDFVRADNPLQLFTVVFNQCCWSAPYRKPTRLITNLMSLKTWGPNTWPVFGHDGAYKGLLRTFAAALLQFHWLAPLLMTPFALPQLPSIQSLWTEPLRRPFCFLSTPLPPKLKRGQRRGSGRRRGAERRRRVGPRVRHPAKHCASRMLGQCRTGRQLAVQH